MKTLHNSDVSGASKNVPDLVVFGKGDLFKLLTKASSKTEDWMKSTKAFCVEGEGCLVQVTTQQGNGDGTYAVAEALAHVPGVCLSEEVDPITGVVVGRTLVPIANNIELLRAGHEMETES